MEVTKPAKQKAAKKVRRTDSKAITHSGSPYDPIEHDYHDADGRLLFQVLRYPSKNFIQRRPDGRGGWIWNSSGVRRIPYRLPEILACKSDPIPIVVVEGEKDVDRLFEEGLIATTCPGGAGKWSKMDPETVETAFRSRDVIVIPDNDDAGRDHGRQVVAALYGIARSIHTVELPGLPEKGDVSDWLDAGGTAAELLSLAADAAEWSSEPTKVSAVPSTKDTSKHSLSQKLVALVDEAGVELWHTPEHEAFATIPLEGRRPTYRIRSSTFKRWLAKLLFDSTGKPPNAQATNDALAVLEGRALFSGPEDIVYVRTGRDVEGRIIVDLGDNKWRAISIGPGEFKIVPYPIRFRRERGMLALPEPAREGTIETLREFLNLGSNENDWYLVAAWLTAALRPEGPYPILALHGEQGTGKSTFARLLRNLIDPSSAPLRAKPREARDLMIAARNSWVLAFDNLSKVPTWLSDALCRLSTGGGFSTRELYSDSEETILDAQRPVLLTGIDELATRGDLLDRTILVYLRKISESQRQSEGAIGNRWKEASPGIFHGICRATAGALAELPNVQVENLPRMADFALWGVALERALDWPSGAFLRAYEENQRSALTLVLEGDPVAEAVLEAVNRKPIIVASATELLAMFTDLARDRNRPGWVKTPNVLGQRLRRLAPALRKAHGVEIGFERSGRDGERSIWIERVSAEPSSASSASSGRQSCADNADNADNRIPRLHLGGGGKKNKKKNAKKKLGKKKAVKRTGKKRPSPT